MTINKPSNNTNNKTDKTEVTEWQFEIATPVENMTSLDSSDSKEKIKSKKTVKKNYNLELNDTSNFGNKTRSEMAVDLQNEENIILKDEFEFAPTTKRAAAFGLDIFFGWCVFFIIKMLSPLILSLSQYLLDRNDLKFTLSEQVLNNGFLVITTVFVLFFSIIMPLAFFNNSFGKKIFGLRVRGVDSYTISISKAIKREFILKPISILIIAGFITPFISKKRQSIHDMLSDTLVIAD